ncbi:MAG: class I SAM-dependent methyltransferase [Gammaproteobacteria bacterium]|nr:MAG: class I SAM-dependent methyltransferase [Gammaproteobacteria bacterium]
MNATATYQHPQPLCKVSGGETASSPSSLAFADKYDVDHAQQYDQKHPETLASRLSNWREQHLARQALIDAGNPDSVLDLPCGAGRFWPLLAERSHRQIYAADNSADMLQVALTNQPPQLAERVIPFRTSAFAINLPDSSVDNIFCMGLLHHIEQPEQRRAILREFHRVTRDTVVLSLWVDGNYKAWRRRKLERKRAAEHPGETNHNRLVISRTEIEQEFQQAGFKIVNHRNFLIGYAMWRIYTLRKENNNEIPFSNLQQQPDQK